MTQYDLIIVGAGQTASPLSRGAAKKGWRVAVVEENHAGGTCVNVGCTPTKTLVAGARVIHNARTSGEWGAQSTSFSFDWTVMRRRRDALVGQFRRASHRGYEQTKGIDFLQERAQFIDPHLLKLMDSGQTITAPRIVLDVGGAPVIPNIPGLHNIPYSDSSGIQVLDDLPPHLLVLGGGYIGLEFAQIFRRMGSSVTVVHRGKHILSREDEDVALSLTEALESEGITILTGTQPKEFLPQDRGFRLNLVNEEGMDLSPVEAHHVLCAVGRAPQVENLGLENTGVERDSSGSIHVDGALSTTTEGIWAVGDCKGGPAFTHIAYDDYRVLRDLWDLPGAGERTGIHGRPVPYTVFTDPQLGRIGLSEKQALQSQIPYHLYMMPYSRVARAMEAGETAGLLKVLVSPRDDHLLGAAIVGMEGGEVATMLQLAMAGGLCASDLQDMVFAHPGLAESFNNLFTYGKRS
ncbi:MAG: mercuric reductase [Spirochaetales bacterium]|nr:mercuric reductase [Spirochaetales bacterium]